MQKGATRGAEIAEEHAPGLEKMIRERVEELQVQTTLTSTDGA